MKLALAVLAVATLCTTVLGDFFVSKKAVSFGEAVKYCEKKEAKLAQINPGNGKQASRYLSKSGKPATVWIGGWNGDGKKLFFTPNKKNSKNFAITGSSSGKKHHALCQYGDLKDYPKEPVHLEYSDSSDDSSSSDSSDDSSTSSSSSSTSDFEFDSDYTFGVSFVDDPSSTSDSSPDTRRQKRRSRYQF